MPIDIDININTKQTVLKRSASAGGIAGTILALPFALATDVIFTPLFVGWCLTGACLSNSYPSGNGMAIEQEVNRNNQKLATNYSFKHYSSPKPPIRTPKTYSSNPRVQQMQRANKNFGK